MRRAVTLVGMVLVVAGCGSHAADRKTAPPPRLPRVLARAWTQQANAIAASLAANDGCTAKAGVAALQQDILSAVNAHRIPRRLLKPLSSGVNDLAAQVTCVPSLEPTGNENGNGKAKGHKKHGRGNEGGD